MEKLICCIFLTIVVTLLDGAAIADRDTKEVGFSGAKDNFEMHSIGLDDDANKNDVARRQKRSGKGGQGGQGGEGGQGGQNSQGGQSGQGGQGGQGGEGGGGGQGNGRHGDGQQGGGGQGGQGGEGGGGGQFHGGMERIRQKRMAQNGDQQEPIPSKQ